MSATGQTVGALLNEQDWTGKIFSDGCVDAPDTIEEAGLPEGVLHVLGGNSPLIVLDHADIVAASSAGAWGSFLHQGQICISVSRHLVHESIAEQYLDALTERAGHLTVGNPATTEVALGPIINEKQVQRVQRIVDDTVGAGASTTIGGNADGLFYPATVLRDVRPGMAAFDEEIFGPVAPVTTFRSDEEALELANGVEHGLAAAVQSGSQTRAADFAEG